MKVLLSASRESISVERVNEMSRFDTDLQPMVVGCQMQSTHNLVLRSHLLSFHGYCFLCSLDHVANSKQLQCIKGGLHILTLGEFTAAYIVSSVEYLSSVNLKARWTLDLCNWSVICWSSQWEFKNEKWFDSSSSTSSNLMAGEKIIYKLSTSWVPYNPSPSQFRLQYLSSPMAPFFGELVNTVGVWEQQAYFWRAGLALSSNWLQFLHDLSYKSFVGLLDLGEIKVNLPYPVRHPNCIIEITLFNTDRLNIQDTSSRSQGEICHHFSWNLECSRACHHCSLMEFNPHHF